MSDKRDLWGLGYRAKLNLGDYAHQLSRGTFDRFTSGHEGVNLAAVPPSIVTMPNPLTQNAHTPEQYPNIIDSVAAPLNRRFGGGTNTRQQESTPVLGTSPRSYPQPSGSSYQLPKVRW